MKSNWLLASSIVAGRTAVVIAPSEKERATPSLQADMKDGDSNLVWLDFILFYFGGLFIPFV